MKTAKQTVTIECRASFGYLTVGDTYTVEIGKREVWFRNVRTGGGTCESVALYRNALATGKIVAL